MAFMPQGFPVNIEHGPWWLPPRVVLLENWFFEVDGIRYDVLKGFVSDAASIPRGTRWWTRPFGLLLLGLLATTGFNKFNSMRAAMAHDHLYQTGCVPRARADRIFRLLLKRDDVWFPGRWIAWVGVRLGGAIHYNAR